MPDTHFWQTHRDRGKWFIGLELQRDWIINQRRIDLPGHIRQIQSVDAADRGQSWCPRGS